jgi:hypothetical protein
VHVNKSSKKNIILRNDGVMPSTCLFDLSGNAEDFTFPLKGSSITLQPGSKESIEISFSPQTMDENPERKAVVKITVFNNPFDTYSINVCGTAYACDAVLDLTNVPGTALNNSEEVSTSEEQIVFPEINLAEGSGQSSKTIFLRSRSAHPLKYEFTALETCNGNLLMSYFIIILSYSLNLIKKKIIERFNFNLPDNRAYCTPELQRSNPNFQRNSTR